MRASLWSLVAAGTTILSACADPTRPARVLRGPVEAVTPPTLQVSGITIVTHANTQITTPAQTPFDLSALRVGDLVTVQGSRQSDGSWLADGIETEGAEVELRGVIDSVTPPNLTVAGRVVVTDSTTEFEAGDDGDGELTLADFHAGDTVKVEGMLQPDSTILAREIELRRGEAEQPDQPEENEVQFDGVIDSVTPPDRLLVSGRVVVVDSNTEIRRDEGGDDLSFGDLLAGDTVEVEGTLQPDSTVLAKEIEVRRGEVEAPEAEQVDVEGVIDSLAPPDLFVAGTTVHTDSLTEMRHDGEALTLSDFHGGDRVKVRGVRLSDGSILARRIEPDS